MPPIHIPLPASLLPGIQSTIAEAYKLVYFRGVYDGFIGGVLLALLLAPHIRNRGGDSCSG
jgi:hypothetical protein